MADTRRDEMRMAGAMLVGGAAGAVVSRYGSNWISDLLTKDLRIGPEKVAPTEVQFWRKAPFWDVALGLGVGALGLYGPQTVRKGNAGVAVKTAAVYLIANGVLDMIGDFTAEDVDKQYNGRPMRVVTEEDGTLTTVGPLSRRLSRGSRGLGCGRSLSNNALRAQSMARAAAVPSAGGLYGRAAII